MNRFHQHKAAGVGGYRRLALLLIAAIIGGLLQPLFPAQTAAAQRISQPAGGPPAALKEPAVSPSSASAPAATVAQQAPLVNVAQGRIATQSSTAFNADASRAIDGWTWGNFYFSSVTHSYVGRQEWWQVDLGATYPINTVDLWNRTDCCTDRLRDFYVFVSDVPFPSNDPAALASHPTVSTFFTAGPAGEKASVAVNRTGRYVRVQLKGSGILSLAEVQVWSSGTPTARPAHDPFTNAIPGDGQVLVAWYTTAGAASYRLERASANGVFSTIATGLAAAPGQTAVLYTDTGLTNDNFYSYRVTAFDSAGQVLGTSEDVYAKPNVAASTNATNAIPAASNTVRAGARLVQDGVLGREVIGNINNSGLVSFSNLDFSQAPNGVSLRYRGGANTQGYFQLIAFPGGVLTTVPVTNTYGAWSDSNAMVYNAPAGSAFLVVMFVGQGGDQLAIDQLQFSKPGPFDTAEVKWDPNIVLLHKSMGIALDNYLLDQGAKAMLMQFSTTTAQGRAQFGLLKVGSVIASDTNLDLGGPYARVTELVSLSDSQVAVKAQYVPFNQLIYAGGIDLGNAITQSFNTTTQSLVGTSALAAGYDPSGYDTIIPNVVYQDDGIDSGNQARSTTGLGNIATQSSDVPTVSVPKSAEGKPSGHFHVTLDNIQFINDEDGFGIEIVNLKMNGLGVTPISGSNPVASQNGFGVLGGVGADTLRLQIGLVMPDSFLTRGKNLDIGAKVTAKAHLQIKGLAVALWFFDVPAKFLKPIRFPVPTPVGPMPSSLVFGLQGYIIAVGNGQFTAEFGAQITLNPTPDPRKLINIGPYGDFQLGFGQSVKNTTVLGFALEPYAKLRFGDFSFAPEIAVWVAMGLGLDVNPDMLKKLEGLVVFTFTPRMQLMNILKNWKDKDTPIFEQKACAQPVVKAEALPGFPKKMTFELRVEVPFYACLLHTGWLYYDMKIQDAFKAGQDGKAKIEWGVPIFSEKSNIPHTIIWEPVPYQVEEDPQVISRDISAAFPGLNAAERRRCLIFRKPVDQNDTVDIVYNGPCQPQAKTDIQLPTTKTEAVYILRVMTEYRRDSTLSDVEMIKDEYFNEGKNLPWGVWSDKPFLVVRPNDTTTFTVNATEVFSDSATTLKPVEGTTCDPTGQRALGMTLKATIAVIDPSLTKLEDVTLQVDGADVAVNYNLRHERRWELQTAPMDLFSGAHSMTIVAKERSLSTGLEFTVRYPATFKAQAKSCGRAKPDDMHAVVFEGSPKCPRNESPEVPLDVLNNDDQTDGAKFTITSVTAARLGTVKVGKDGQNLLYKPKSRGVDSFVYTAMITVSGRLETASANVLVNNRLATTDEDCAGGGGGGGNDPGNGSDKRGKAGGWGDPHLSTADSVYFDSHAFGEFTYLRPKPGRRGITIQGRQEQYVTNSFPAITTALAVKVNGRVVEIRSKKTPRLLLDGAAVSESYIDLGNGASLTISSDHYTLRGDNARLLVIIQPNGYLNFEADVPLNDTLEGLLGTPNDNPADDLRLPDGTLITGTSPDYFVLADGWRITDRTASLFTYAAGEGPETYNKVNPYRNMIPDDTTLAPYKTQARTLLANTCDSTGITPDERRVSDLALELFIGTPASAVAMQLCSYEISGRITSSNPAGAPVVGTSVNLTSSQINGCTTITDSEGRYRCKLSPIPNAAAVPTVNVTVAGGTTSSVVFPRVAPINGTLTSTLDLVVTRPTLRLTVRTINGTTNTPTPNTTVEVQSSGVRQQVTTNVSGTASLVLTYQPGATSTNIRVTPVAPAFGNYIYQSVTLNPSGPVDLTLDVRHIVLGTPTWVLRPQTSGTTTTFNPVSSATLVLGSDGTIYSIGYQQGTTNGPKLVATRPDGTLKWVTTATYDFRNTTNSGTSVPVVGTDGTAEVIYVIAYNSAVTNSVLYAFNTDGSLKWVFDPGTANGSLSQPAIAADGTIYLFNRPSSTSTGRLLALNPADGSIKWNYPLTSYWMHPPLVGKDGTIYVSGNTITAINPNGTLKQASTRNGGGRLVMGGDGTLYHFEAGDGESSSGFLQAINPDLTLRWSAPYGQVSVGPDGSVYSWDNGRLRKLNPATGATVWTFEEQVHTPPVIAANGDLFVGVSIPSTTALPFYYQLVTLDANKTVKARFNLGNLTYGVGMKMAANGTIYATVDGNSSVSEYPRGLYAIPTGANGLAASWSSVYSDNQNTNRAR